jgi:hypothetical protein
MHIPEGSLWNKWDLHIHPPFTQLSDAYKGVADPLDKFCDEIEKSDVLVFGITDYFSLAAFNTFVGAFAKKYPMSTKKFFFNLELRLNEAVNKAGEEVNIHLIFNPASLATVPKFLRELKITKTGENEVAISCDELKAGDFKSATVSRQSINDAFIAAFGTKAVRKNHFLVFTAANNDGIRPERGKMRKRELTDEIDKLSDGFIGSSVNVEWYLTTDRLDEKDAVISPKPVITGSDSHSFDDFEKFVGKQVILPAKDADSEPTIEKEITWIKADPTYEGLKQITYDPISGERVFIGPLKPDQKDDFKVIRKIKFVGSSDFPDEIVFNSNLASIIGSRSSGKSALLAYLAYKVDPFDTKSKTKGAGEGEAFHWDKLALNYTVEWANGKTTVESKGKVIYLPQNFLFDKSKEANEVKKKIAPILFQTNPSFKTKYDASVEKVNAINAGLETLISQWFGLTTDLYGTQMQLMDIGDKTSIATEKGTLEGKIEELKIRNNFNDQDLQKYQQITEDLSSKYTRIAAIAEEQQFLIVADGKNGVFDGVAITMQKNVFAVPDRLQTAIDNKLKIEGDKILIDVNKMALAYIQELATESTGIEAEIIKINSDNAEIIEKYRKNEELQKLIGDLNRYKEYLTKIDGLETKVDTESKKITKCIEDIEKGIGERSIILTELKTALDNSPDKDAGGIIFGMEFGFEQNDIDKLSSKINVRDRSEYVDQGKADIQKIRSELNSFLGDIHSQKQKLIQGQSQIEVARQALTLTEKILFSATMEGDTIGGFKEPTMTPGKRSLFALRLILAESDDKWPLLIDQPEDDLDSRSIYDEIVPFLKLKKKERQIIMVSHNANLVIGADSEQLIIANRHGADRVNSDGKQFNYLTGSLEFSQEYNAKCKDTLHSQGVCEHACAILDGGRTAFETRKNKYNFE